MRRRSILFGLFGLTAVPLVAGSESIYALRRALLIAELGDRAVFLNLSARAGEDRVAQDPNFFYLSGLDAVADAAILITAGEPPNETLYLPPRDRARERWLGPSLGPGTVGDDLEPDSERRATADLTGFRTVKEYGALAPDLLRALAGAKVLYLDTPTTPIDQPLSRELRWVRDVRERLPRLEVADPRPALLRQRVLKSEAELTIIRRAVAVTLEAQREVARSLHAGQYEYEVIATLEYVFRRSGASGPAFPSIVASGPNATTLHYRGDRRRIEAGELVVVDIGARVDSYAADVTRTYPVGGRFGDRQREIYEVVLAAQDAALKVVKPGARLRGDVHAAARAAIEAAGYGKFFTHGTSHYVGLEVHDIGDRDAPLEAGMVITVEPGIYLSAESLGVRIEDMVLVTERGYELLTRDLPRSVAGVEAMMKATVSR